MSNRKETGDSIFTKSQLLSSAAFRDKQDVLTAILEDGKPYTKQQAKSLLDNFLKGKVK